MSDDKVRRELRDVLRPHVGAHSDIVANAILASGLLDQIRADAWDDGVKAGRLDEVRGGFEPPTNPYRTEG